MSDVAYVLHLTLEAFSTEDAIDLSRRFLRLTLGVCPAIDVAASALSAEDDQQRRQYLFCSQSMPGGERCMQRPDHHGLSHSPIWVG
jgi:hypothetical protein